MLELFKHILSRDFDWLSHEYGTAIYTILFIVIFVETGVVVFPFLPGDSLLFMAGLFAHSTGNLNMITMIGLLVAAAVIGDNCNYLIGRTLGLKVTHLKFRNKDLVKQKYIDQTQAFYDKYGVSTIIMARFVPFVRTFAPFVAGVAKMDYKRFLPFDIIGGALWICSMTFAGWFLGEIDFIKNHVDLVAVVIILLSILPIIIKYIQHKRAKK